MAVFSPEVLDAAAREKEAMLTTRGRRTGRPNRVTIWLATDGQRIFVRSGQGLERHWPRNLLAARKGTLHLGKHEIAVSPRHVMDSDEARAVSRLYAEKYGSYVKPSGPSEPLTPGEKASFELNPIDS